MPNLWPDRNQHRRVGSSTQQLLGSHCLLFSGTRDVMNALFYWSESVSYRMTNPYTDSRDIELPSFCSVAKEVNTLEELEELGQDEVKAVHVRA